MIGGFRKEPLIVEFAFNQRFPNWLLSALFAPSDPNLTFFQWPNRRSLR